jgi:hypothetical protein
MEIKNFIVYYLNKNIKFELINLNDFTINNAKNKTYPT